MASAIHRNKNKLTQMNYTFRPELILRIPSGASGRLCQLAISASLIYIGVKYKINENQN